MITKLRIRNFKGWKDTGSLRLAPITVLFGTNSSGKSSLGQFLMMLKQTANSPDRTRVLHPGDVSTPVDLGTLEDLLYRHDASQQLDFTLQWTQRHPLEIRDVLTNQGVQGKEIEFGATIGFETGKGTKAVCRGFHYSFCDLQIDFSAGMQPEADAAGKFQLTTEGFEAVRKTGRVWPLPSPVRFFGFPDELIVYYQNAETLGDFTFALQNLLRAISYLGPLREEPKRHYAWAGETPEDVGRDGGRWISAFLAAANRKVRPFDPVEKKMRNGKGFDVLIAELMQKLGLIHSFSVAPLAAGVREYRVKLQVSPGSPEVSIPDVGFGVSQLLPVLVQSFYAPPHSTVIIEQPELHLHPAVQQNLADMFIGAVKSREDGEDRNVQFIIESHSEHFLRRLQRRIAEGVITKDEVAAYFCEPTAEGSKIQSLEVDLYGTILNWPPDFFGDQMTDVAEMQKAGIRRRREARQEKK